MAEESTTPAVLEWEALDYHPHERGTRWHLIGGVFIIGFAAYGLFDGSWSTALVALLIGAMYFVLRNVPPRRIKIQINGLGIKVDGVHYNWNSLKSFWIIVAPGRVELRFARTTKFAPELLVFIEGIDGGLVREALMQYLPEQVGMEERLFDIITRILKL